MKTDSRYHWTFSFTVAYLFLVVAPQNKNAREAIGFSRVRSFQETITYYSASVGSDFSNFI